MFATFFQQAVFIVSLSAYMAEVAFHESVNVLKLLSCSLCTWKGKPDCDFLEAFLVTP